MIPVMAHVQGHFAGRELGCRMSMQEKDPSSPLGKQTWFPKPSPEPPGAASAHGALAAQAESPRVCRPPPLAGGKRGGFQRAQPTLLSSGPEPAGEAALWAEMSGSEPLLSLPFPVQARLAPMAQALTPIAAPAPRFSFSLDVSPPGSPRHTVHVTQGQFLEGETEKTSPFYPVSRPHHLCVRVLPTTRKKLWESDRYTCVRP